MPTAIQPLRVFQLAHSLKYPPLFAAGRTITMKLFDRLWRSAPTCTHSNSTAVRSEIGHNAIRRYYWFCGRCGEKVYVQDWKGKACFAPGGKRSDDSYHGADARAGGNRVSRWTQGH